MSEYRDSEQLQKYSQYVDVTRGPTVLRLKPGEGREVLLDDGTPLLRVECVDAQASTWRDPVSTDQYHVQTWYCAQFHRPGVHTGLDLNTRLGGRGDAERRMGMGIYAIAAGVVTYVTDNWSGVGMIVVDHSTAYYYGPLFVRYAHIVPVVTVGERVQCGAKLGAFADWRTGDHLHFDMRDRAYSREWLAGAGWLDPEVVLKRVLSPSLVETLLADG